jgi:hypothetical protein
MTKKKTVIEFKKDAFERHGYKYDYSEFVYINTSTPGKIICHKQGHGIFLQRPNCHLQGQGCPKCGKIEASEKLKLTLFKFIEKAETIQKHKDENGNHKYEYKHLKEEDYINNRTKISIYCIKCGKYFMQNPYDHLQGHGCLYCANIYIGNIKRKEEKTFFKECNEIHNNKYEYISQYTRKDNKIIIKCPCHGEFEQIANDHVRGHGCRKCCDDNTSLRYIISKKEFMDMIKEFNCDLLNHYDFTNIPDNFKLGDEINIKCNYKNKILKLKANTILYERIKCSWCNYDRSKRIADLKEMGQQFIEKAKNLDIHKNQDGTHKYNYDNSIYKGSHTYVQIYCYKCKKNFYQIPLNHLRSGCRNCCNNNYSKKQIIFLELFQKIHCTNIQHSLNGGEYTIKNSKFKADGYSEETNTIYEFNGDFWHGNPKIYDKENINKKINKTFGELYYNTIKREEFIKEQGYNIVAIWERDWDNLIKIVIIIQKKWRNYKKE